MRCIIRAAAFGATAIVREHGGNPVVYESEGEAVAAANRWNKGQPSPGVITYIVVPIADRQNVRGMQ